MAVYIQGADVENTLVLSGPAGISIEGPPGTPSTVPGPQGAPGPKGEQGDGIRILGSVATPNNLPSAGAAGDLYTVFQSGDGYSAGDGYSWTGTGTDSGTQGKWKNIGALRGPAGPPGPPGAPGGAGQYASLNRSRFSSADGNLASGQTVFTISSGYTAGMVQVFLNGKSLTYGFDFTATDGSTVNLVGVTVTNLDVIEIISQRASSIANVAPLVHTHTKDQVGLANVDNTSDTTKATPGNPIGTAIQKVRDGLYRSLSDLVNFNNIASLTVKDVFVPSGTWTVTSNLTIPKGFRLILERGAVLRGPTSGSVTLTIRALFEAPCIQIFGPNLVVVGIAEVLPEWWGAVGDGVTDDQPALQAAHDCAELSSGSDGNGPVLRLKGGGTNYGLGRQLTFRPTASFNLRVIGGGCVLGSGFTALASFSASLGFAAVRVDGTTGTIQQIAGYQIGNFYVAPAQGTSALVGFWIGGDGTAGTGSQKGLIGVQANQIHDVHVKDGFAFAWRVANCRLIDFNRCSGWNRNKSDAAGLSITVDAPGAFTGDLNFNSCQFIVDLLDRTKCVTITNGQSGGAQIKGIRFNDTTYYHGDRFLEIYATNGGAIGDIWVNPGCQFDGFGHTEVFIQADGVGSVIDDIHIKDVYMRGFTNGNGVYATGTAGGTVATVMVQGNWIASLSSGAKACFFDVGCTGCSFNMNTIQDVNSVDYLILVNASRSSVIGNMLAQGAGATTSVSSMVAVGTGVDYCVVTNNNSGGFCTGPTVLNLSSATHNILDPNI